jgi:hypothetical protein
VHKHDTVHAGTIRKNAGVALSIGVVHGFAGFSHLLALLPSLALPSLLHTIIYIGAFAVGTIFTMILFSFILGMVAFQSVIKDKLIFLKWFTVVGGVLAIAIGLVWIGKGV